MELLDGFVCFFGGRVFDEGEATGFAGNFVDHQIDGSDWTCLGEIVLEVVFHGLIGKIPYEEPLLIHNVASAQENRSGEDCPGSFTECRILDFTDKLSSDTDTFVL